MIECVTVCVNFCDYLKLTLPGQKHYFDNVIIVTDSEDKETQEYCEEENITCVITDVFYEGTVTVTQETWLKFSEEHKKLDKVEEVEIPAVFNKARALNEGFKHLKFNEWVAVMDADTAVDNGAFELVMLGLDSLSKEYLYGSKGRILIPDTFLPNWEENIAQWSYSDLVKYLDINSPNIDGYFQLFHYDAVKDWAEWYPNNCPSASLCDVIFHEKMKDKWGARRLPFMTFHLGEPFTHHEGRVNEKRI